MSGRFTTRVAGACALLALSAGVAACGGGGDDSAGGGGRSGDGLPAEIPVTLIADNTGVASYVGQSITKGVRLGVEEVNESGELGEAKLVLTVKDTGTKQPTAVSLMAAAVKSDAVAAFSPALSNETLAAAPIAQRGKLPLIALQSNDPGVPTIGDYIYRVTAPQDAYNGLTVDKVVKDGAKTVALIYNDDNVTTENTATGFFAPQLEEKGVEVVAQEGMPTTATDVSAVVSKVAAANPDAIGIMVLGPQNAALVKGLRQSGYEGAIFANAAVTTASLDPAGKDANGVFYAHDYTPADMPYETSRQFTDAYQRRWDEEPTLYSASAYDGVKFLAKALAEAQSADREAVLEGMGAVATSGGFEGATGPITFTDPDNRDVVVPGVLVEYRDGKERLLATGKAGDS